LTFTFNDLIKIIFTTMFDNRQKGATQPLKISTTPSHLTIHEENIQARKGQRKGRERSSKNKQIKDKQKNRKGAANN
jgi:hypothetical protein